jgi:hypothetical protein
LNLSFLYIALSQARISLLAELLMVRTRNNEIHFFSTGLSQRRLVFLEHNFIAPENFSKNI